MPDLNFTFWEATVAGAVRAGTPIAFAAIGELIYERGGVLNLSIEGIMLVGALAGVATHVAIGILPVSLAFAVVAGSLLGLGHGVICVRYRANQVVTGLALVTFLQGLTALLGRNLVGQRVVVDVPAPFVRFAEVPFVGRVLFVHDVFAYTAVACAFMTFLALYRTRAGIALRAVGENAQAAEARGLQVVKLRLFAAAIAGGFAGLGGAYLALVYARQWQEDMVAGRGWIAFVLVICSLWRPRALVVTALFFGALTSLPLTLQAAGFPISSYLLGMLPFVVSILVLVTANLWIRARPLGAPADLARPYEPLE